MKPGICRRLCGKMILLSTALFVLPNASYADAYQDFDLGSTMNATGGGGVASTATGGTSGNQSFRTNEAPAQKTQGDSKETGNQQISSLPGTTWVCLDKVFGGGRPLPKTTLDSFVKNAAGSADLIYGDEGADGLPPFNGFEQIHRIERGIHSGGLTTGHRSPLPEAWGWPN